MLTNNSNKIVLIVEDIVSNHLLIERSLDKLGLRTIWANNGVEAVNICTEISSINLVLMDLRLPIMDGYEASKQIRALRPDLPIIAQTAYLMPYEKNKIIEAGCTDLITKPYKSSEIISIVEKYI